MSYINTSLPTTLELEHTNANNIVFFDVWKDPLPNAYHFTTANNEIVLFSYNSIPDNPQYINCLISLNDYWIYVPSGHADSTSNESNSVPEPSTGIMFFLILCFIFLRNKSKRKIIR